ncbi:hypothetical protein SUGI_0131910 [Cryptomeria japonica]|uniref:uncharacterized protein LOC131873620 n=1 Tax=Cryptomeria japonica TaxID=3369 RepID=UPI002408D589|nr:uncharacterized protein LOC131873620 [Cryptomeria japonica]GLJ10619.1 hypothetical protein SUGI_0131910 [Cryptomeria japonica]
MAVKPSEAMTVRFLINTKTQRIVYAEAGKEFVDFLFSFLSMPIGSVLNLLYDFESNRNIGSISNLYDSMEKLPTQFMSTDKSQLLDPKFITTYSNNFLRTKHSNNFLKIEGRKYYVSSYLSTPKISRSQSYCSTTQNISITHNISTSSGNPLSRV